MFRVLFNLLKKKTFEEVASKNNLVNQKDFQKAYCKYNKVEPLDAYNLSINISNFFDDKEATAVKYCKARLTYLLERSNLKSLFKREYFEEPTEEALDFLHSQAFIDFLKTERNLESYFAMIGFELSIDADIRKEEKFVAELAKQYEIQHPPALDFLKYISQKLFEKDIEFSNFGIAKDGTLTKCCLTVLGGASYLSVETEVKSYKELMDFIASSLKTNSRGLMLSAKLNKGCYVFEGDFKIEKQFSQLTSRLYTNCAISKVKLTRSVKNIIEFAAFVMRNHETEFYKMCEEVLELEDQDQIIEHIFKTSNELMF